MEISFAEARKEVSAIQSTTMISYKYDFSPTNKKLSEPEKILEVLREPKIAKYLNDREH